jgi:hypothetical protein
MGIMLVDFADELRKRIEQRLEASRLTLEGSGAVDKPRGRIEAFREVLIDLDEIVTLFLQPESVPEALQDKGRRPRRVA